MVSHFSTRSLCTSAIALSAFCATALAALSPAAADEAWDTDFGRVIYEKDVRAGYAEWSYEGNDVLPAGKIFIEGLAGVYEGRTSYTGYWFIYDPSLKWCNGERRDPPGIQSETWGRFEITFLDPSFPARWQAKWGICNGEATQDWIATPIVGR